MIDALRKIRTLPQDLFSFVMSLFEDIDEIKDNNILVKTSNGENKYYKSLLNTDTSRGAILRQALAEAGDNDVVTLVTGGFLIPNGQPMSDSVSANNVKLDVQGGAHVIYDNENDAPFDSGIWNGNTRYGEQFGIFPNLGIDVQKRIQAALFSMPSTFDPTEGTTDYPALETRSGKLILQPGGYSVSKTICMTSYQELVSSGGRRPVIYAMEGFAGAGDDEKFIVYVSSHLVGGVNPAANFNFGVRVVGIQFANQFASNTKTSALYFACGQGGEVDVFTTDMGHRGVVLAPTTSVCEVSLWAVSSTGLQTGPHLELNSCRSIRFGVLSLENINKFTAGNRKTYTTLGGKVINLPGLVAWNSFNLSFSVMAGESIGSLAVFDSCNNIHIDSVDCVAANTSNCGEIMIRFSDCDTFYCANFVGTFFEKLYQADTQGVIVAEVLSNNSSYARAGGISQGVRTIGETATSLTFVRGDGQTPNSEGAAYSLYNSNTNTNSSLFVVGAEGYSHIQINHGESTGHPPSGQQDSTGFNVILDDEGDNGVFVRSKLKSVYGFNYINSSVNPTTGDIARDAVQFWYNASNGQLRPWANVEGVLRSGALFT